MPLQIKTIFEILAILERVFHIFHQFIGNLTKNENFNFYHVTYNWGKF